MEGTCDFSGWATRHNILCSDGLTIRKDAFKDDNGAQVPLVWMHQHDSPSNVIGHAILENREDGVYAYCTLNNSQGGLDTKELIKNGDVRALSIHAGRLKKKGNDVVHGKIREVSVVLAGANDGAYIDTILCHGEDSEEGDEALVYLDDELTKLEHAAPSMEDVYDTFTEDQKTVVLALITQAVNEALGEEEEVEQSDDDDDNADNEDDEEEAEHADTNVTDDSETDASKSSAENQQVETKTDESTAVAESTGTATHSEDNNKEDGTAMKRNVFDKNTNTKTEEEFTLSHDDFTAITKIANQRLGSLKAAFEEKEIFEVPYSTLSHGVTNIEYLFPDAKLINNVPEFIKRDTGWVSDVMGSVHRTPFSRIKSVFADLREDDARAKGYIKGNAKVEQVFGLLKRVTTPQTIYKKQKLERDDVIDIVDMDIVAWIKTEMRMQLEEEIARAILVGDGRSAVSEDKINPDHVRPIWTDDDLFTIKALMEVAAGDDADAKAKLFIRQCLKSRKDYKGAGNPTLFTTEDMLTDCLLLEDEIGRRIYDTATTLATALRVSKIVTVPVMENLTRSVEGVTHTLAGIIVNLQDYNVGADKGGAVNMFDDFDINYNALLYLIETRLSGALIKPFSAIALEYVPKAA